MGPKKVVVLTGYKTVKEALVNYAEEFGEREPFMTVKESKLEHGRRQRKHVYDLDLKSVPDCRHVFVHLRCFMVQRRLVEGDATLHLDQPERLRDGQEDV